MKARCPHCSQHVEVDAKLAGTTVKCPACEKAFSLPVVGNIQPVGYNEGTTSLLSSILQSSSARNQPGNPIYLRARMLVYNDTILALFYSFAFWFCNKLNQGILFGLTEPSLWGTVLSFGVLLTGVLFGILALAHIPQSMKLRMSSLIIYGSVMAYWVFAILEPECHREPQLLSGMFGGPIEYNTVNASPVWYKAIRAIISIIPFIFVIIIPAKTNLSAEKKSIRKDPSVGTANQTSDPVGNISESAVESRLEQINELHQRGLLNEDEYHAARTRILQSL